MEHFSMDRLKAEAVSFSSSSPPPDCREVYREPFGRNGSDTLIIYYNDKTGEVYYSTEYDLAFAARMEAAQKKKKS